MGWDNCSGIVQDASSKFFVYCVSRKSNKKGYIFYEPEVDNGLKDRVKEELLKNFRDILDKEQETYNPVGNIDNKIYTKSLSKTLLHKEFLNAIDPNNHGDTEELVLKNIDFFVYEFSNTLNQKVFCISKHRNITVSAKEKLFVLAGNRLSLFSDDRVLRISAGIDIVIYEDTIYSINNHVLESVFDLRDEFKFYGFKVFENNADILSDCISNFENFKTAAIQDSRHAKRLARMYEDSERIGIFTKNMKKTIELIKDKKLQIDYDDKNNKLIFNDQTEISDMISILQDSHYVTLLGGRKGEDIYS